MVSRSSSKKQPVPESRSLPDFEPLPLIPFSPNFQHQSLPTRVNNSAPYKIFALFFTKEFLETLASNTNQYAAYYYTHQALSSELQPHQRPWVETNPTELKVHIGVYVYMGLHPEAEISEYWNQDSRAGPLHPQISNAISLYRWEQIDRFLHLSPLHNSSSKPPKESSYTKLRPLSDHLLQLSKTLWKPRTHLSIDEAMARFLGRTTETVRIPSKPIPEGFKIWVLADSGYILHWVFHTNGVGPESLSSYWTKHRGFANTQAVVLELALVEHQGQRVLQPNLHHIWLDNLFTTSALLAELRRYSIGASGTVRTTPTKADLAKSLKVDDDLLLLESTLAAAESSQAASQEGSQLASQESSNPPRRRTRKQAATEDKIAKGTGLSQKLVRLRKQYNNAIPWGTLYSELSADTQSIQFAWKDQNVVLFMSTIYSGDEEIVRTRRKPGKAATNAVTSRRVFEPNEHTKQLAIPLFIDAYNHYMGGVDQADQLRSYYTTQRRHIKPWKALFHWLLDVAITNSFKLSIYAKSTPLDRKHQRQRGFRRALALSLLECSEYHRKASSKNHRRTTIEAQGLEGYVVGTKLATKHHRIKVAKGSCKPCLVAGRKRKRRELDCTREPLAERSPNIKWASKGVLPQSRYGCELCGITICNNSSCWEEHVQASKRRKH